MNPARPRKVLIPIAPTKGVANIGKINTVRIMRFPGKSYLATMKAKNTPSTTEKTVTKIATYIELMTAPKSHPCNTTKSPPVRINSSLTWEINSPWSLYCQGQKLES